MDILGSTIYIESQSLECPRRSREGEMDGGFYCRIDGSQLPAGTSQHTHGASFSIEPRPLICMRVTCPEKSGEHLIQLTSCCSEVYFTDYDKYDNWGILTGF